MEQIRRRRWRLAAVMALIVVALAGCEGGGVALRQPGDAGSQPEAVPRPTAEDPQHPDGVEGTPPNDADAQGDDPPPTPDHPPPTPRTDPTTTRHPDLAPGVSHVCTRTALVQTRIVQAVSGKDNCSDVTAPDLAAIEVLSLCWNQPGSKLTALRRDDFSGLVNLQRLELSTIEPNLVQDGEPCVLTDLPDGIFQDLGKLTRLLLFYQPIRNLRAGMFEGLANVTYLGMDAMGLTTLPADVFRHLPALSSLLLSENKLTSLPSGVFANNPSLASLDLSYNLLEGLPEEVFSSTPALDELDLTHNRLQRIPADVFAGPSNLRFLWLGSNRLATLPPGALASLSSLQILSLVFNPGAPFQFVLQLEETSDAERKAVRVRLPWGSPFRMEVALSATGGTLSSQSVELAPGDMESDEVTVTPDDVGSSVTVTLTAPGEVPKSCRAPKFGNSSPCYSGFQVVAGEGISIPGGAGL